MLKSFVAKGGTRFGFRRDFYGNIIITSPGQMGGFDHGNFKVEASDLLEFFSQAYIRGDGEDLDDGGMEPRKVALTHEEINLACKLGECATAFSRLEQLHPSDGEEFVFHIHALQNIVVARAAVRAYPEVFRVKK